MHFFHEFPSSSLALLKFQSRREICVIITGIYSSLPSPFFFVYHDTVTRRLNDASQVQICFFVRNTSHESVQWTRKNTTMFKGKRRMLETVVHSSDILRSVQERSARRDNSQSFVKTWFWLLHNARQFIPCALKCLYRHLPFQCCEFSQ